MVICYEKTRSIIPYPLQQCIFRASYIPDFKTPNSKSFCSFKFCYCQQFVVNMANITLFGGIFKCGMLNRMFKIVNILITILAIIWFVFLSTAISSAVKLLFHHFPKVKNIRWTGKVLRANPVRVFMSGDLGGKQSHAFPQKTIKMNWIE